MKKWIFVLSFLVVGCSSQKALINPKKLLMMIWRRCTFITLVLVLTSCSSSSLESRTKSIVGSAMTGNKISYGNTAECSTIRTQCLGHYKQWQQNGEIACSCSK